MSSLASRVNIWVRRQVSGDLLQGLVKRASAVLVMQVAGLGAQFLTGIILGRLLGATEYGRYAFVVTLVVTLRVGTALGFPTMLLKSVAAYYGTKDWAHLRGLMQTAALTMAAAGAVLATVIAIAANLGWPHSAITSILLVALPLLIILPLSESAAAAMKGLHRLALSQVPEFVRGLLYLAALAGAVFFAGVHLDARNAIGIRVGAEFVGLVATICLLMTMLPADVREAKAAFKFTAWRAGLISFAAGDAMHLILQQIDVVMLGIMRPMADVGVYRMAANFVTVIFFASIIAGVMVNPLIASSWAQGKRDELQDICVRLSRVGFVLTLLVYVGLIAMSPVFIMLLGPGFKGMVAPLAILGAGNLFRALMSAAPSILLMTGGERDVAWGIAGAAILNTLLNLVLIPLAGLVGASMATAISMALLGVFFAIRARQRTGIDGTIFGHRTKTLPPPLAGGG